MSWARALLVFLLAFWLIPPCGVNCQTFEEQVAAHFRAGQQALRQGELEQAEEEFKKVLALDPNLAEARVNLGLVYHSLGEYRRSAENLATAMRQKPDLAGPTLILGIDYLKLGEADKAMYDEKRRRKLNRD